jgi:drug/metabolite transporter (DMT)-like permease
MHPGTAEGRAKRDHLRFQTLATNTHAEGHTTSLIGTTKALASMPRTDSSPLLEADPVQQRRIRGLIFALMAACCFSPDALLTRLALAQRNVTVVHQPVDGILSEEGILGAPCVIAAWKCLALGLFNLLAAACFESGCKHMVSGLQSGARHVLMASSCQCVQQLGFTLCYVLTDPATALLLVSLNPLWAALLGWRVLNDELPTRTVVCLGLAFGAVGFVVVPPLAGADGFSTEPGGTWSAAGDAIAAVTGLSLAGYIIVVRHAAVACPGASMSASAGVGSLTASAVAFCLAAAQGAPLVAGLDAEFALIAVSDAFIIAMGYVAMSIAPRLLTGAEVAMTMLLQVLLAPLLVFICLGEAPSRWTLSGGSLLLVVLLAHEAVGLFRCEAGGAGGRDREQLEAVVTPPDDRGSVNQACNQATTAIDHQSGSRSRAQ